MNEADRSVVNTDNQASTLTNIPSCTGFGWPFRGTSGRYIASGRAVRAGALVNLAVGFALSLLCANPARAQAGAPLFANPPELKSDKGTLRGVIELTGGTFLIPNVGRQPLRQFRGGYPNEQIRPGTAVSPGPTLRARLGEKIQISFFNKINNSEFPPNLVYTPTKAGVGCDDAGSIYPGQDTFPNCFHGSSTANIHFHGTHTSPDGLGDNVLVQILPEERRVDIFSGNTPQTWSKMPAFYQDEQKKLVQEHDKHAAEEAAKKKRPKPESLWDANQKMIDDGLWPQYLMGAFPNYFEIPEYDPASGKYVMGQAPGTHWYHAHKHGSTSLHILNGLAGAFIIESSKEDGYDHVIRKFYGWGDTYKDPIRGDHDKIIVFQEFDPTQNLERQTNNGRGIKQILVNGQYQPKITMRPGEVQLWRFINATEGNNDAKLRLNKTDLFKEAADNGFQFRQTAMDGVQFSEKNYENQPFLEGKGTAGKVPGGLTLAAGNRADILVQAPDKTGEFKFINVVKRVGKDVNVTLFSVSVEGTRDPKDTPNGDFPTKWAVMPPFLKNLDDPSNIKNPHEVKFEWEKGRVNPFKAASNPPGIPPHFMIDGTQFREEIDQCMPLNGLQDWLLENRTSTPHPFHIHINPFQIVQIDTPTGQGTYNSYKPDPKDGYVWQDVITIPQAIISSDGKEITPGKVTIRHKFVDFTGTYVLHCHILAHEDRGMMQLVRVTDKYPGGCKAHVPAHH
jgi:FtsP/CotA-like multicopper oxidase with cupredoxin domain